MNVRKDCECEKKVGFSGWFLGLGFAVIISILTAGMVRWSLNQLFGELPVRIIDDTTGCVYLRSNHYFEPVLNEYGMPMCNKTMNDPFEHFD